MFRKRSHCLQWLLASEMEQLQLERKQIAAALLKRIHQTGEQMFYSWSIIFSYNRTFSSFLQSIFYKRQERWPALSRPLLHVRKLCLSDWEKKQLPFLLQLQPHHSTSKFHELTQHGHANIFQESLVVIELWFSTGSITNETRESWKSLKTLL